MAEGQHPATAATSTGRGESLRAAILIGWLIAAVVLTAVSLPAIGGLYFPDPDDAMRYLEVRDWLAGQSWWDVSQHRLWGGHFAMHWSRLVDLPLAAGMLLLDPLLGKALSTRVTVTLVPLGTLLCTMSLAAILTRRLAGIEPAKLAVLLTPLSVPLVYQMRPLRIDHHGWQVVLALVAVVALIGRPNLRTGAVIGVALGTLLTISLEGLPITAAIVGVATLAWVVLPARRAQLAALAASLPLTTLLLHLATRGPGALLPACDAIAPAWLAALGVGCGGLLIGCALAPRALFVRLLLAGATGLAAIVTIRSLAPLCTRGPFATLDPLVYRLWYKIVSEGLPVWEQVPAWAIMTIALPMVGLIGGALAWRVSADNERIGWTIMLAVAVVAFALSLLVMRSGATANALAIPGAAWLANELLGRAREIPGVTKRTLATAGVLLAVTPAALAAPLLAFTPSSEIIGSGAPLTSSGRAPCDHGKAVADFARLPRATLFAPIDITPSLLAHTDHRAIGAGYHRNAQSIHMILATFMARPEIARQTILASGAGYVVGCPGENETERYRMYAPDGLWARLERGERFDWLQPVDLHSPALAWRVVRPLPRGNSGR